MSKEILMVVESVSNEKGVPAELIFEALELALVTATKKRFEDEIDLRVTIDRRTGDYESFRRWTVVVDEELDDPAHQLTPDMPQALRSNAQVGEILEEKIDSIEFGRIAAQTAKQVIVQKVREAERMQIVNAYRERVGEIVSGTVKKVSRDSIIVDLDIVLWDENPAQFVINSMSPSEVVAIVVDEDTQTMDVAVADDSLAQAIGRGGQNVRLASQLTGWTLNVMTEADIQEKQKAETGDLLQTFVDELKIDEDLALVLIEEGFSSLEDIAYVPVEEMLSIDSLDEEIVNELRLRAKDRLLTKAIAVEKKLADAQPAEDLLSLEGMDKSLAQEMAVRGIITREHLAEQSISDLLDINGIGEERAGKLIMAARAHWFE
ncbi:UNVERIFIED_CONTAM: hypothetical protein GTU68_056362 [Idotea baltica]|nr:hypothetical protein [Idotea baltica]